MHAKQYLQFCPSWNNLQPNNVSMSAQYIFSVASGNSLCSKGNAHRRRALGCWGFASTLGTVHQPGPRGLRSGRTVGLSVYGRHLEAETQNGPVLFHIPMFHWEFSGYGQNLPQTLLRVLTHQGIKSSLPADPLVGLPLQAGTSDLLILVCRVTDRDTSLTKWV